MELEIVLVEVNRQVVRAWREALAGEPSVEIVQGSLFDQRVDAWVSPTNARAQMNGGLDGLLARTFGPTLEARVQREVERLFDGVMPVGAATCVETGLSLPRYLVSAPTMYDAAENVSLTDNVALACGAALQAIAQHNRAGGEPIRSVALTGMGTGTGGVSPERCAALMACAIRLHQERDFDGFAELELALLAAVPPRAPKRRALFGARRGLRFDVNAA